MSSTLSPGQAAKRAGVSRWTISRALQSRTLKGEKNNLGHWRIRESDLDAWLDAHPPAVQHTEQLSDHDSEHAVHALRRNAEVLQVKLDAAEARLAELSSHHDERIADLVRELDEARTDARAHRDMLASTLKALHNRPSLLERLIDRIRRPAQSAGV